jgi:hypothetical protein
VFTVDLVHEALVKQLQDDPETIAFTLAPEPRDERNKRDAPLHMQLDQVLRVHALRETSPDAKAPRDYNLEVNELSASLDESGIHDVEERRRISQTISSPVEANVKRGDLDQVDDDTMLSFINRVLSDGMTDEERRLKSFSRRQLKTLPNWETEWRPAFYDQMDAHHKDGTFGEPCPAPPGATIVVPHWACVVKPNGKRKARLCCNGSKKMAPSLHRLGNTYASCIEQPCLRLFFALASARGHYIRSADCTNAFAQTDPPPVAAYMKIDESYRDWYQQKYKKPCPDGMVLPIEKALQGHPMASYLWSTKIQAILLGPDFNLKWTTHERNLYSGVFDDEPILVCRQVDDFAIAAPSEKTTIAFIERIRSLDITIRDDGPMEKFNGVDVRQARDHVQLSATSFIERMLISHGWDKEKKHPPPSKLVPMTDYMRTIVQGAEPGPAEGTKAHKDLEDEMKFAYRTVLGELLYAYVIGRFDIGYAVTTLARYAASPAKAHYQALVDVAKYLRQTAHWGLIYWRPKHACRQDFPHVEVEKIENDPNLPAFPTEADHFKLVGYFDASHAADAKTRKSVTGIVFCLAGGCIAFRSKQQPVIATSSTEAEFVSGVQAGKMARYLRSILKELGNEQVGPTVLYCDNESAIKMVNNDQPTERSRHIDIGYFVIQQWRARGDLILKKIPGTINPSDAATKSLAWVLHERHVRRAMGHFGFP